MTIQTYNIPLMMTEETRQYWLHLLFVSRDAFNRCAELIAEANTNLGYSAVHNLCYDVIRESFPELPAQGVIRVQKAAAAAFKSIRSNKHRNADTPVKHSLSLQLDKRLYSNLTIKGVSLASAIPHKREHCGFNLYGKAREMLSKYNTLDPTLFYRNGQMYLSVPFEIPTLPCSNDTAIGVDLGVKRLFVTSEGLFFKDKNYLKQRRKIRYLKRILQAKGTNSAKKHLRKAKSKERNVAKDMVERATKLLVQSTNASVLVIEDLSKIKTNTSKTHEGFNRKRHNNMLSQVPFHHFKERLSQKAQLVGKRVETVSPAFTSQTDSRTNKRDGNRVGCRYICSDGVIFDADWNAALNIAIRSNHPTSRRLPINGGIIPLVGRAQSTAQSSEAFCFMASPRL